MNGQQRDNSIKIITAATQEVFSKARYVASTAVIAVVLFLFAVWLPNIDLITQVIGDPNTSLAAKLKIPFFFLGAIGTNFSFLSASYTIAIALLFGINVSMMVYYFKKRKKAFQQAGVATSFGGFMSGMLGIGCAACGSFILTTLGAAGAVALLPLKGAEFGIISIGLLGLSIASVSKKIKFPMACKSEHQSL